MKPKKWSSVRQGFTLLELILAAALSLLVMLGVSGVIMTIYQVQQVSNDQLMAVELSRNLFRQFEWDLHAIHGTLPEAVAADASVTDTSETLLAAGEAESTVVLSDDDHLYAVPYWFVGNATTIAFHAEPVRRTGRQFAAGVDISALDDSQQPRKRYIQWGLVSADAALNMALPEGVKKTDIVRAEGLLNMSAGVVEAFVEALPVPEVLAMEFSFFDGSTWVDSWNSNLPGSPPKAIELTLTLATGELPENRFVASETPQKQWTMRRVFHIPAQRFATATSTESTMTTTSP